MSDLDDSIAALFSSSLKKIEGETVISPPNSPAIAIEFSAYKVQELVRVDVRRKSDRRQA